MAAVSTPQWSRQVVPLNDAEDLREAMRGANLEAVHLKHGRFQGSMCHIGIGSLGMTVGKFNSNIRHKGPMVRDPEKVAIGTLLTCPENSSHWWEQVTAGVIGLFPANAESDAIYGGGAHYVLISISIKELIAHVGGEQLLADPAFWNSKRLFHSDPHAGQMIQRNLSGVLSSLDLKKTAPSPQAIDFLRRAILECFVTTIARTLPQDNERPYCTGARLVSEAENYVDAAGARPVHISELCSALNVSRRSLHRAFAEALDMGPVAYLRRRRLARVHAILSQSTSTDIAIADLAFEHGFPEPARFSAYYRSLTGETPSETRRLVLTQQRSSLADPAA
jgi:AraC family ethanolamine operon transcriptional activator